jgi:hypothetical protein
MAMTTNREDRDDLERLLLDPNEWNEWRRLDEWSPDDQDRDGAVVVHSRPGGLKEWCRVVNLTGVQLIKKDLRGYNLRGLDLTKVNFSGSNLTDVNFERSILDKAIFDDAILEGANLGAVTSFRKGSLLRIQYNGFTKLPSADRMSGCQIERSVLEDMKSRPDWSSADTRRFKIRDDLAELRTYFGGYSRWLTLTAIILFMLPYIWFVAWQSARSYFLHPSDGTRLLVALFHLIWTGGGRPIQDWTWSPLNTLLFTFLIMFNTGRTFLVWKTLELEERYSITGHYPRFYLSGNILRLYQFVRWALWINLAIAFVHTILHLWQTRIPN